jgi:hypothetical protein
VESRTMSEQAIAVLLIVLFLAVALTGKRRRP